MINGHLLVGLSHEEAVAILRSATGMVQLVVASKVGRFCFFVILSVYKWLCESGQEPFPCHTGMYVPAYSLPRAVQ